MMENNLTREVHWFTSTLLMEFTVEVEVEEIGVEAVDLGLE